MQALWLVLGLLLGGGLAALVTRLVVQSGFRHTLAVAQSDLALATARGGDAQQTLAAVTVASDALRQDLAAEQQQRAALAARLAAEADNLQRQTEATRAAVVEAGELSHALAALKQEHAGLLATVSAERQAVAEQRQQTVENNRKLHESFAAMSADALKHNREDFLSIAEQRFKALQTEAAGALDTKKAEMGELLTPMRQTLDQYREQLAAIEQSRTTAYVNLSEHLAGVAATQQLLSTRTEQLVTALRRPSGRGRWGELTLRRLFELAGLAERVTFHEQVTADEGRMRPDCVVTLPEDRQVIVDSKCVLDAFLSAASCADDAERTGLLTQHAQQVRSRVNDLSGKEYQAGFAKATDYVILFLPGEAFLYAAVEHDPMLIEDAMKKRIIVASPSTLLGLLRVIEHGWQRKKLEENAAEIRTLGSQLYERVQKAAGDLQELGQQISRTAKKYNEAVGSLETRVLPAARKMSELGVGNKTAEVPVLEDIPDETRALNPRSWKALTAPATQDAQDALA